MDPITIAVLSASIILGLAGAALAGLRAWSGWLELKKMELAQVAGDRGLPPATGRIEINGVALDARDGAAIMNESVIRVTATEDAEIVLVDAA